MKREQLEHIIRAASNIVEDNDIVIIGSQSILATHPNAPSELLISNEADVYPRNKPELSDVIDGAIGEGSMFQDAFGYYAQGVSEDTATLPDGWKDRLVAIHNENTHGATGWALDVHDMAISKYVANREKDRVFLQAAVRHRLLNQDTLTQRLALTKLDPDVVTRISTLIAVDFARA